MVAVDQSGIAVLAIHELVAEPRPQARLEGNQIPDGVQVVLFREGLFHRQRVGVVESERVRNGEAHGRKGLPDVLYGLEVGLLENGLRQGPGVVRVHIDGAALQCLEQDARAAHPELARDRCARGRLDGLRRHFSQHIALGKNLAADHDRRRGGGGAGQAGREQNCHEGCASHCTSPESVRVRCALMNWETKELAGCSSSSRGVPDCTTRPSCSMVICSARYTASPRSWVTRSTVLPSLWKMDFNSCCRLRRIKGSKAAIGSSNSMTAGSIIAARMMETRCFWPPLISRGNRDRISGSRSTTLRNSSTRSSIRALRHPRNLAIKGTLFSPEICGNSPPSCGT